MAKKKEGYLKSVKKEYKKINWPNMSETMEYTSIVLLISFLAGLSIWILDKVYSSILSLIIR